MALYEMLVMAKSGTHPNPVIDKRDKWKKGDPVVIRPTGCYWGPGDTLPMFLVVKCEMTAEDSKRYVESEYSLLVDIDGHPVKTKRRKYKFDIDTRLTPTELQSIKDSDWKVITVDKTHIEDKIQ